MFFDKLMRGEMYSPTFSSIGEPGGGSPAGGSPAPGAAQAAATTDAGGSSSAEPSGTSEGLPAGSQQSSGKSAVQDAIDYSKDERLKRMWMKEGKFDPNLMYKSVRNGDDLIEKQFKPLKAQADAFTNLLKTYGFEPDVEKLKPAFEELKKWRDPENPLVKRGNYLSFFLDDPEFKGETETFLESLRMKAIRREFGEGTSPELVKEILANRQYREETERKEKARQEQERQTQMVSSISGEWKKVEAKCKELGIPTSDEMRVKLLTHCRDNGIPTNGIYYEFQTMFSKDVEAKTRAKIQEDLMKTLNKGKKSGIIPAGNGQTKSAAVVGTKGGKSPILDRVMGRLGYQKT